jgi:hypothetical protein
MRLLRHLNEARGKNVIIVDVQEAYRKYIHFDMYDFCSFLNKSGNILCLYNGEELGFGDQNAEVVDFYIENGLDEQRIDDIQFIDKGYGFLRGWMDYGVDDDTIIKTLKYMKKKSVWDSRDLEEDDWKKLKIDMDDIPDSDPIYFPGNIDENMLRHYAGSYIVGGGENECLKEVQLYMKALGIRYTEYRKFIY